MTKKEFESLKAILGSKWHLERLLREFLANAEVSEDAPGTRTLSQNSALHVDCQLIADKLNDAGLDMRATLKPGVSIPWTLESVKEHLFKPIMKLTTGKDSTRQLKKQGGEIDRIHEVLMRELGEKHGIEWHDFPHDKDKGMERLASMHEDVRNDADYPELDKMPEF